MARSVRSSSAPLSPEVLWYLESRGIPLPDCPPAIRTPEPRDYPGAMFDAERVDRVLDALGRLRHTKGPLRGQPLRPDPWQIAYVIAPVFGWVYLNDHDEWARIINKVHVEVPRKNGKTTLAGGVAIYLTAADGEGGAEVYAAAGSKDQARFCFDPVKSLVEKSPELKPHLLPLASRILHKRSGSYFAVVSHLGDLLHGGNVHGAIIDELHIHKTDELVEALETGMGSRSQPLAITITTAGSTSEETVYARRRKRIDQLAAGKLKDPSTYAVIWAADASDDPFVESTWRKANPGYGISPTRKYMESAAAEAQQSPTKLMGFLRLHLNIRTSLETRWMPMDDWDACRGEVDEEKLAGQPCWAGLDLSQTRDLTAFLMVFPTFDSDGIAGPPYRFIPRFWIPEEGMERRARVDGVRYDVWVEQGLIRTTSGSSLDFETIERDIRRDAMRFAVQDVAADPRFAWQMLQQLDKAGLTAMPFWQSFQSMSAPTADLLAMVKKRQLQHGGNEVLRWMADNVVVEQDVHGNWRPSKRKSSEKIDGIVAAVMAVDRMLRWIHAPDEETEEVVIYDERVEIGPRL